jgi:hypothetical protein
MDNRNHTVNALLVEIYRFMLDTGMPGSHFGKAACTYPNLIWRLEAGMAPTARTIDAVRAYIAEQKARPEWPKVYVRRARGLGKKTLARNSAAA